jgi:hypothetical protein
MTKAKYEDDTGESGWIADETKEEREAREVRERHAASVGGPTETKEQALAISEEERLKKREEEAAAKEPVRAKIVRLVGELRSGRLFGAERKRAWGELEATAGGLKTEELVGESDAAKAMKKEKEEAEKKEKERKKEEEKEEKKEEKAGRY